MTFHRMTVVLLMTSLLFGSAAFAFAAEEYSLRHPINDEGRVASGDGMTVLTGHDLLLSAQVVPVANANPNGVVVRFTQVTPKEKVLGTAITGDNDMAKWVYIAGTKDKPTNIGTCVTAALALNLAKVEIIKMGELVKEMAVKSIEPLFTGSLSEMDVLHEMEE